MTFMEHLDAMRKDMQNMAQQMQQNKIEIEKTKQELTQIQLQMQQHTGDQAVQIELAKYQEMAKKLESIAKTYIAAIPDSNAQGQMMGELESLTKGGSSPAAVAAAAAAAGIPMVQPIAAMAAAAMQPHMMMRNPLMNAMGGGSPRVGKGAPNGGLPNGMNGLQAMQMAAHHQMQMQMHAMLQAQMMHGVPMMGMPGMTMPGMPPGMAGLPGMLPPGAAAAMQQLQAQHMAQSIAVSTPSRNQSNSGVASRTRTPLTASATNSPRPSEPPVAAIKEEEPTPADPEVSQVSVVNEDSTTVAVA